MKPSESIIFIEVKSYDEKPTEIATLPKNVVSKVPKISIANFESTNQNEDFFQKVIFMLP